MNNKLKQITSKAKQLYKSGKFAKWTDAIKAASASLPGAKKSKKIGYKKDRLEDLKKITKIARKQREERAGMSDEYPYKKLTVQQFKDKAAARYYLDKYNKKISGVKKTAKKVATKKASTHKDTNSHNVKISVMSGNLEASKAKHLTMLKNYYGKLQAEYFTAKGTEKTKLKKVMSLIKKDIMKLK